MVLPSGAIERLVSRDSHPVAVAALRIVIPQRQVLCASIVPERYGIRLPSKSALEFSTLEVPEKHLKNYVALTLLELDQARSEQAVDEQSFAAGLGMSPHYRMLSAWELGVVRCDRLPSLVIARAIMNRG